MRAVRRLSDATLSGRHVQLIPVAPEHYEYLRVTEIERLGVWWRNAGTQQSPAEFAERIWAGMLVQVLAVSLKDQKPLVWLQCYNADPVNRTAALAVARLDAGGPSVSVWSAAALFIEHCFDTYGFRKIYTEIAAPNLVNFESLIGPLLVEEARLVDHLAAGPDEYCDLHILAMWHFAWKSSRLREALLARA